MSLTGNPTASFGVLKEKAVGFFLDLWKRLQKKEETKVLSEGEEVVAVDLGHSHLLVLSVERRQSKHQISHFRMESRPPTVEAVSERLRSIFKEEGLSPKKVRVALKGQGVVMRFISFPQMKRPDFAEAIRYEVEKYIPFRANEVILDFQILNENIQRGKAQFMEVLLVAVKQTEIYETLRLFQNADIDLGLIDISALAFANLVEWVVPETKQIPLAFLDIGSETSTFGIMVHAKPVFIRDISFGGVDILKLLGRKLGLEAEKALAIQQDPRHMKSEYREVVEEGLANFLKELKLSIGYYMDRVSGAEPIQSLFLGGGGSRFIFDSRILEQEIRIPTKRLSFLSQVDVGPRVDGIQIKKNEDLLPVALGLCCR